MLSGLCFHFFAPMHRNFVLPKEYIGLKKKSNGRNNVGRFDKRSIERVRNTPGRTGWWFVVYCVFMYVLQLPEKFRLTQDKKLRK